MKTKIKVFEAPNDKSTIFGCGGKCSLYIGKNSYSTKSKEIWTHIILYKSAFPKGERNISLYIEKKSEALKSDILVNRDIRGIIGGEK